MNQDEINQIKDPDERDSAQRQENLRVARELATLTPEQQGRIQGLFGGM